jgi:hypothetical protein
MLFFTDFITIVRKHTDIVNAPETVEQASQEMSYALILA